MALSRRDGGGPVHVVDSWQAYLAEVAYHLRAAVAADPDLLRTLTAAPRAARWLRPPVGDLVLVEEFLASMKRYGLSDEEAATAYLTFFTRLLGLLRAQASRSSIRPSVEDPRLSAYPTLMRLRPWLTTNSDDEDFDTVLDDVLTGLERELQR